MSHGRVTRQIPNYAEPNHGTNAPSNTDDETDSSAEEDQMSASAALVTSARTEDYSSSIDAKYHNIATKRNLFAPSGYTEGSDAVSTRLISEDITNIQVKKPDKAADNLEILSVDQYEINPKNLKLMKGKKLGEGHFGDVSLGLLTENDGKQVPVAVKQSKVSSNTETMTKEQRDRMHQQLNSLLREISIMAIIGMHPNVLKLIGAVTKSPGKVYVVTEYCEYGSLDKFLRKRKQKNGFINDYITFGTDGYSLQKNEFHWKVMDDPKWAAGLESRREQGIVTTSDLLWFGLQIAGAMDFLTKQSILHRDIALRNILLASGYIVKVADFGLSRKIKGEIYQPLKRGALPVGYLAPETLEDRQFSCKSESWALGIVLWELLTLAERQPYLKECGSIDGFTISAFLNANKRLPIPEITPISIQKLISQLWSKEPADRPDFEVCQSVILEELKLANLQFVDCAEQMWSRKCDKKPSLANLRLPFKATVVNDFLADDEDPYYIHKFNDKQTSKSRRENLDKKLKGTNINANCFVGDGVSVIENHLFPTLKTQRLRRLLWYLLPLILATTMISAFFGIRHFRSNRQEYKGFVPVRHSWTFNASQAYNHTHDLVDGPEFPLNLGDGTGCTVLLWKLFFKRNQTDKDFFHFPFFLEYVDGVQSVAGRRSMLLTTNDGREIMQGNDFDRPIYEYKPGKHNRSTWAANSTHLVNSSENDPLTLKVEVFVDPASAGCQYVKPAPQYPINYEEECKKLPTKARLFWKGACYVGSNTKARVRDIIRMCNDIPSAKISHLAWVKSKELLGELNKVLIIRNASGVLYNPSYYIGAKLFSDAADTKRPPIKSWYWFDNNGDKAETLSKNFTLSTRDTPIQQYDVNLRYGAISDDKIIAVNGARWFRYLCEYRWDEDQ